MGREIRRVPANWEHPKDESSGHYRSMFEGGEEEYRARMKEWQEGCDKYGPEDMGHPYSPDEFIPIGEWYQLFENVSEGTPISPPFETTEELVDWLTSNPDFYGKRWTREAAESIVRTGYAFSMMATREGLFTPEDTGYWKGASDANRDKNPRLPRS